MSAGPFLFVAGLVALALVAGAVQYALSDPYSPYLQQSSSPPVSDAVAYNFALRAFNGSLLFSVDGVAGMQNDSVDVLDVFAPSAHWQQTGLNWRSFASASCKPLLGASAASLSLISLQTGYAGALHFVLAPPAYNVAAVARYNLSSVFLYPGGSSSACSTITVQASSASLTLNPWDTRAALVTSDSAGSNITIVNQNTLEIVSRFFFFSTSQTVLSAALAVQDPGSLWQHRCANCTGGGQRSDSLALVDVRGLTVYLCNVSPYVPDTVIPLSTGDVVVRARKPGEWTTAYVCLLTYGTSATPHLRLPAEHPPPTTLCSEAAHRTPSPSTATTRPITATTSPPTATQPSRLCRSPSPPSVPTRR